MDLLLEMDWSNQLSVTLFFCDSQYAGLLCWLNTLSFCGEYIICEVNNSCKKVFGLFNVERIRQLKLWTDFFELNFVLCISLQTEEEGNIQLVDLSFVISNPPPCLMSSPFILASFLRGAGIVLTSSQEADDGERYEEQVVFQPENCQKYLGILEALLTVLVKGMS